MSKFQHSHVHQHRPRDKRMPQWGVNNSEMSNCEMLGVGHYGKMTFIRPLHFQFSANVWFQYYYDTSHLFLVKDYLQIQS